MTHLLFQFEFEVFEKLYRNKHNKRNIISEIFMSFSRAAIPGLASYQKIGD